MIHARPMWCSFLKSPRYLPARSIRNPPASKRGINERGAATYSTSMASKKPVARTSRSQSITPYTVTNRSSEMTWNVLTEHQAAKARAFLADRERERKHLVIYLSGAHAYGFPSPDSDVAGRRIWASLGQSWSTAREETPGVAFVRLISPPSAASHIEQPPERPPAALDTRSSQS